MDSIIEKCSTIDRLIKEAKHAQAMQLFQDFENKKWPRQYLIELCHLARRLNRPFQILKWMHPIVRSELPLEEPAQTQEIALYVMGLVRIGAFREAETILKNVQEKTADIYLATYQKNVFQWKYAQTIRPIKNYMQKIEKGSYLYKIAQVNLLAALVVKEEWDEVEDLKSRLLEPAYSGNYPLMRANALESYAQGLIRRKLYAKAGQTLEQSAELLKNSGSWYEVFVAKWKLFLGMLETNSIDPVGVHELRIKATKTHGFETLREIDFYQALISQNETAFQKVYHGTRFSSYKQRMKYLFGKEISVRPTGPLIIQMTTAGISGHEPKSLKNIDLSNQCENMMKILFTDHYRPLQMGELFRDLYPDEYFNPHSSPRRLHQVFCRLKRELKDQAAPFEITWLQNQIRWEARESFLMDLDSKALLIEKEESCLHALPELFSLIQLQATTLSSRRNLQRKISEWIACGKIKRTKPGHFKKVSIHSRAA